MTTVEQTSSVRPARRAAVTNPGHGDIFTDHMFSMLWSPAEGWHQPEFGQLQNLSIHPGMIGLHYGQVAFEGLKAHRRADGSMVVFRPREHARRFQTSTSRLAMPELPTDIFMSAVNQLVAADQEWLSDHPAHSLYLRPLMFATDESLMLRPSENYRFLLMAFVAGGFFGDRVDTVSVLISRDYCRAIPGGTGNVKVAGNYAPSFVAQRQAQEAGCHQVVWLDAIERRWVEEMGGMNLFFVRSTGTGNEVVTPQLTGSLLPGVTRDALLTMAERLGYRTREERISVEQWRQECAEGTISEVFACGTAAVVTPVGTVRDPAGGDWTVGDGLPGPVTMTLRRTLMDLHHGLARDTEGWLHPVPTEQ
ncbi:branched-chain amino acid aminotransferase [Jatrophihabitans lederbergiae]|uniref:Branched-chain-amino-acid aminotransferase n=1 Tax=Jatrophihabitans lederbergiae TaxID=3075547 RepID=A0ABU2JH99_9ACTN|nr:branched-chain amino acid aminotransferase [Jatrophihabitans sp. DSM 44399]MDT0264344.1 branched-chain amino acid aminotransferase [Jatrophihabitans sp. DSM 44399]